MPNTEKQEEINRLSERVVQLQEEIKAEREALRKSVKREWKFSFFRADDNKNRAWMHIRANSGVRAYVLHGAVWNLQELRAAGWNISDNSLNGTMAYLVNFATPTPKVIKADGGGTVYIKPHYEDAVFAQIEALIAADPDAEKYDITAIITDQPDFNANWR